MKKTFIVLLTCLLVFSLVLVGCEEMPDAPDDPGAPHVHEYSAEWSYDADNHWHECTAGDGAKKDEGAHVWNDGTVTAEPTEQSAGTKVYECTVCHKRREESIPKTNHVHDYGTLNAAVAATCTDNGNVAYYRCSGCGKYFDEDKREISSVTISALGHDYAVSQTIREATTTAEGEAKLTCHRCDDEITRTLLALPVLTMDATQLHWNAVDHAAGYYVYSGETKVDAGKNTSMALTEIGTFGDAVAVRAYPAAGSETYADVDECRSEAALTGHGENVQAFYNGDFESNVNEYVVAATNGWSLYPYGNWSNAPYYVIAEEDGNMCAKIPATVWYPQYTRLQKDLDAATCAAGSYRLSFDVKLSANAKNIYSTDELGQKYGHINVGLWTGLSRWIEVDDTRNNLSGADTDSWTTLTFDYTLDVQQGNFMHLCVTYWPEVTLLDNYVLLDNIKIVRLVDGEPTGGNIDSLAGGDFERWNAGTTLGTDEWIANNTVLIEASAEGSSMVTEADGNTALKIYSERAEARFNLAGNPQALGTAGLYEMTFRLKKGAGLTSPDFGFILYGWANSADAVQLTEHCMVDIGEANDETYTDYRVVFYSKGLANCGSVNIFFWIGLQNAQHPQENKYIILDDVDIRPVGIHVREQMNVLMIGNSFTDDTIEYVVRIANNVGYDKELNLYGLFIGGCDIDTHWNNFDNKLRNYDLRKWNAATNSWTTVAGVSIQQTLRLQKDWTYVSFQQNSAKSGLSAGSFEHLIDLTDGVRAIVGEETEFIWLGTWSYTTAYGMAGIGNDMAAYDNDQMTMYNAIVDRVRELVREDNEYGFVFAVPSGTAVQNLRAAVNDDTVVSRDERHLSFGIGRFTSSLTFAAKVLGIDVDDVTYRPSSVSEQQAALVKAAVKAALENPYEVTEPTEE